MALQGFQRRHLRRLAHPLRPVVQVGAGGVSETLLGALDAALEDHELVKVRLHEPEDKKAAAEALARASGAELCGLVGHTVVLYRRRREGEPRVPLPQR